MSAVSVSTRREFVRTASVTAGMMALGGVSAFGASESGVPEERLARLGSGANICRWFRHPRSESREHFENYLSRTEAGMMSALGLRHVRLCVAPNLIMDPKSGSPIEERARFVEAAARLLQNAGLLVMVEIHNEDRDAELNPDWQKAFVKFWSAFAGRLAGFDPELTMFEIVNEPVFRGREQEWSSLNARLAAAIRTAAPEHTIVTSGPNWGGIDGLRTLDVLPDRNVVYSFHCYDPFPFTHQGATWSSDEVKPLRGVPYPSSPEAVEELLPGLADHPGARRMVENYGRERWNKERLAKRFSQAIEWGAKHGVPLFCGEFGVYPRYARPEHRANWFRDFGEVLTQNSIGWAVWGWDEGFGLNRRMVDGKPTVDPVVAGALGLKTG